MINRARVLNELNRRYDEVIRLVDKGIHDDKQANRLMSAIAHYINYAKSNKLTQKAIKQLESDKDLKKKDKELCDEADAIIAQIKKDRDIIVGVAEEKGVDINAYEFRPGAMQITVEQEFSYYLQHLDGYLNLPSDQQGVSEVPTTILNLTQLVIELKNRFGEDQTLEEIKSSQLSTRNKFEDKLKIHGVHLDYLRFEDFRELNFIWKEVYGQVVGDELLMFHLKYGHLFESNRNYSGNQQREADEFIDEYTTHLSRFHNHLVDFIEDVPLGEEFLTWIAEHFGPTLISVILIVLILLIANWLTGGAVSYEDVKNILP